MNLALVIINNLSEVDFDDLYERAKDAVEVSWPAASTYTDAERKDKMIQLINSGFNNEWPGLNPHTPHDRYVASKTVDLDSGKDMAFAAGFILPDGTYDGRHSLSAADENGSRNWLYTENFRQIRNQFNAINGITKTLYRNIPENSVMHKSLRYRQSGGHYTILEDVESFSGFRNITIQFN